MYLMLCTSVIVNYSLNYSTMEFVVPGAVLLWLKTFFSLTEPNKPELTLHCLMLHSYYGVVQDSGIGPLIMVALWNRADHYIFIMSFVVVLLLLSSFFLCRAISSQLKHVSTIGKNLLSSNMSSTCPHNTANFGPLAAETDPVVWGTPANFNGFRVLAALLHGI